jgi:serine/threonine protein kinase/formylglycine-generating enzyme required for sulfatase activity
MSESEPTTVERNPPEDDPHEILGRYLEQHSLDDAAAFRALLEANRAAAPAIQAIAVDLRAVFRDGSKAFDHVRTPRIRLLLARLVACGGEQLAARFESRGEIARGGMGAILRVFDPVLRRELAQKVLLRDGPRHDPPRAAVIERFFDEAQITAQLDHPGVVPIHDLAIDADGLPFLTMRLVRGENLRVIFGMARAEVDDWSLPRALSVLLRVAETMAYAHSKDVVHRDLKPSNVMVGRFGEAYVMDWGLARALGRPESRDSGLRHEPLHTRAVTTDLRDDDSPDACVITGDGEVLGTPTYMAPEQASGDAERVGKSSDVYAVGAILYELLAGHPPYLPEGVRASPRTILRWVLDGPPAPLSSLARDAAPELIAIADKAMERSPTRRYRSMQALADDLRAWLEGRVVKAYATGALAEFTSWTRRNRATAAAVLALIVVLAGAGFATAWLERERAASERLAIAATEFRLIDRESEALIREADELWPVHPDTVPRMERWLSAARAIAAKKREIDDELSALGADPAMNSTRATAALDAMRDAEASKLETLRATIDEVDAELASQSIDSEQRSRYRILCEILVAETTWREGAARRLALSDRPLAFGTNLSDRAHELARVRARLDQLDDPRDGLMVAVEARRREAAELRSTTIDANRLAWSEAIEVIGDDRRSPHYRRLRLVPQLGLIPLGQDPNSRLFEFWHPSSGARPERDTEGKLLIRPETSLVFVLVPGGRYRFGAQSRDPAAARFDPQARADESVFEADLDPFFLSKYEMTIAQWIRLADSLPNVVRPGIVASAGQPLRTFVGPVENVSWFEGERMLARWNLVFPTEAQWEAAARGGVDTPFWWGDVAPQQTPSINSYDVDPSGIVAQVDGFVDPAPVDAFSPNPFGFYNVLGNVMELCRDWYWYQVNPSRLREQDAEHLPELRELKSRRGGGHAHALSVCRASSRSSVKPESSSSDQGIRPSRAVDVGLDG